MGKFEMLLERATNSNNLDPDLTAIMEMCDTVRQGDLPPKKALVAVKKRLMDKHVLVSYYTLFVLEALMKNCGPDMHKEILVKEVLGRMQDMVKDPSTFSEKSKEKSLELIQTWNVAFRHDSSYLILTSIYNQLAMAGVRFPEISTSDAVFITERPPEWKPDKDSKDCTLCHAEFSFVTRKHHCRNCGECFCAKCCSNLATLPKFGIEREVRVCESCFIQVSKSAPGQGDPKPSEGGSELPEEYLKSALFRENQSPAPADPKRESELREQEEMDLVIAMSLNEQENKPQKRVTFAPPAPAPEPSAPAPSPSLLGPYSQLLSGRSLPTPPPDSAPYVSYPSTHAEAPEEELAKYYNRDYWEERREQQHSPLPARRAPSPLYAQIQFPAKQQQRQQSEGDLVLAESMLKNLDLFNNLLTDTQTQGRSPATDPSVQSLYGTLNAMHPELLRVMEQLEGEREGYEALEQKASMVKEARACLNKSRREYLETVRQHEEQQRLLATMLLEQNIALIRKHQCEQVDMGVRLAEERDRELREEEERKAEEQRRRRQLVNEHQRMQEQQVVAQHLSQVIPGKFEGNQAITGYPVPPVGAYQPLMPPHMIQAVPPLPMYPPAPILTAGPASLPSFQTPANPPPGIKPADPFSPLNSSQALQESGLSFSAQQQYAPALTQPTALPPALQQPSSLPNLGSSPPPNLAMLAYPQQLANPLLQMMSAPAAQPLPQGPIQLQAYQPQPQPQVNQVNLIPPSYSPQVAAYQQSASPVPKEQSLIDFD